MALKLLIYAGLEPVSVILIVVKNFFTNINKNHKVITSLKLLFFILISAKSCLIRCDDKLFLTNKNHKEKTYIL